jgi:hypothetical protein
MSVISVLGRLRKEDLRLEASLCYLDPVSTTTTEQLSK